MADSAIRLATAAMRHKCEYNHGADDDKAALPKPTHSSSFRRLRRRSRFSFMHRQRAFNLIASTRR